MTHNGTRKHTLKTVCNHSAEEKIGIKYVLLHLLLESSIKTYQNIKGSAQLVFTAAVTRNTVFDVKMMWLLI